MVGLLSVGSKADPVEGRLGRGEEGERGLVAVRVEGERSGVSGLFERERGLVGRVLGEGGLPPMPVEGGRGKRYVRGEVGEEGFPEE